LNFQSVLSLFWRYVIVLRKQNKKTQFLKCLVL
jgi:hypothetical protein